MKPGAIPQVLYNFRLYVAGDAANSVQALANLKTLCRTHLQNNHHIEVVDVFREPARALADSIFMTPTLIRLAPAPIRRIVGTLSDTLLVRHAMGLEGLGPTAT